MMKFLYQKILKPILFLFNPELVHRGFVWVGENICCYKFVQKGLHLFYGIPKETPKTIVDGITYHSPVSLSAGFDYNGKISHCLWAIGFGGEEVGSVTARTCVGNESPRLTRLIRSKSILVNKGLRNDGVEKVIARIKKKKYPSTYVLGISIAKTNDDKCIEMEDGINDYLTSLKRLTEENVGDFYTINVSCPNVFGGEDFAGPQRLDKLLSRLKQIPHKRPMYVKLPINKTWEEFKSLLEVVKKHQFNGVVIGNLNKDYKAIEADQERPKSYRGGLSGKPCQKLSTELVKKTRELYPENFTIIGCGGILEADDAIEKFKSGADLVQLITGMIYNGPHLMKEICYKYKKFKTDSE